MHDYCLTSAWQLSISWHCAVISCINPYKILPLLQSSFFIWVQERAIEQDYHPLIILHTLTWMTRRPGNEARSFVYYFTIMYSYITSTLNGSKRFFCYQLEIREILQTFQMNASGSCHQLIGWRSSAALY